MSGKLNPVVPLAEEEAEVPDKKCCETNNNNNLSKKSSAVAVAATAASEQQQHQQHQLQVPSSLEFKDEMCRELSATIFPREENEDWEERCKFLENCIRVLLRHCDETVGVVKALESSETGDDDHMTGPEIQKFYDKFMHEMKSQPSVGAFREFGTVEKHEELLHRNKEMDKLNQDLNRELTLVISEKNSLLETVENLRQDVSSLSSILSLRNASQVMMAHSSQNGQGSVLHDATTISAAPASFIKHNHHQPSFGQLWSRDFYLYPGRREEGCGDIQDRSSIIREETIESE